MNGNGCAGSSACGVSTGKICSRKCALQPRRRRRASISSRSSTRMPAAASSRAQVAPHRLLAVHQRVGLARRSRRAAAPAVSPSAERRLDLLELLALQPGDADHEEFVEIVARDRQEAQPLEQRMRGVARLLEHALVERQPRKLAVEIAVAQRDRLGGDAALRRRRRRRWRSDGAGRPCRRSIPASMNRR